MSEADIPASNIRDVGNKVTKPTCNRLVKRGRYDQSMNDIRVGILNASEEAEK